MEKKEQQNKALDVALDKLIRRDKDPSTILSENGVYLSKIGMRLWPIS